MVNHDGWSAQEIWTVYCSNNVTFLQKSVVPVRESVHLRVVTHSILCFTLLSCTIKCPSIACLSGKRWLLQSSATNFSLLTLNVVESGYCQEKSMARSQPTDFKSAKIANWENGTFVNAADLIPMLYITMAATSRARTDFASDAVLASSIESLKEDGFGVCLATGLLVCVTCEIGIPIHGEACDETMWNECSGKCVLRKHIAHNMKTSFEVDNVPKSKMLRVKQASEVILGLLLVVKPNLAEMQNKKLARDPSLAGCLGWAPTNLYFMCQNCNWGSKGKTLLVTHAKKKHGNLIDMMTIRAIPAQLLIRTDGGEKILVPVAPGKKDGWKRSVDRSPTRVIQQEKSTNISQPRYTEQPSSIERDQQSSRSTSTNWRTNRLSEGTWSARNSVTRLVPACSLYFGNAVTTSVCTPQPLREVGGWEPSRISSNHVKNIESEPSNEMKSALDQIIHRSSPPRKYYSRCFVLSRASSPQAQKQYPQRLFLHNELKWILSRFKHRGSQMR